MKLIFEKAYGIRNKIEFDTNGKKRLIIFAPNGSGKTSIAKTFQEINNDDPWIFGIEGDSSKNSLLLDGQNIMELSKLSQSLAQSKEVLFSVINSEFIEKLKNSDDIIRAYIDRETPKLDSIYDAYDSFIAEIIEENSDLINQSMLNESVSEIFFSDKENKKNDFINIVEYWKKQGNADIIVESKDQLVRLKDDLKYIEEANKIIKERKIDLCDVVKLIESKTLGFDDSKWPAFKLMSEISNVEGMSTKFGFRNNIDEEYVEVEKVYGEIKKEIESKKISGTDAEKLINSVDSLKRRDFKLSLKTIKKSDIDKLKNEIKDLELLIVQGLISSKSEFDVIKSEFEDALKNFVIEYNKVVQMVNKLIDNTNSLIWSIKLEEIKTPFEKCEIKTSFNGNNMSTEDLNDFASTGQKNIIAIALLVLELKSVKYVVLDDILTSLDSDNTYGAFELFKNIDANIIFLTHNFSIVHKISYDKSFTNDTSLYLMDNINEINTFTSEISWEKIKFIKNMLTDKSVADELMVSNYSMLSSLLYEYIDNYLFNEKLTANLDEEKLKSIKDIVNEFSRHWKSYPTEVNAMVKKLNDLVGCNTQIRNIFFGENSVFSLLLIAKKEDEIFANYFDINNFNKVANDLIQKWKSKGNFSLLEWILIKYYASMSIRQSIEKILVNKSKILEPWDKNEVMGLSKQTITNVNKSFSPSDEDNKLLEINQRINFINHLDGLKWIPLFELSFKKLINYIKTVEDVLKK